MTAASNKVTAIPDTSENARVSQRRLWRNDRTASTAPGRVSTPSPSAATQTSQSMVCGTTFSGRVALAFTLPVSMRSAMSHDTTRKTEMIHPEKSVSVEKPLLVMSGLIPNESSYSKTPDMGKTVTVNRKAAVQISHLPSIGARGCTTAPRIRKTGNKKNEPPTNAPATAVKPPAKIASNRVLRPRTSVAELSNMSYCSI